MGSVPAGLGTGTGGAVGAEAALGDAAGAEVAAGGVWLGDGTGLGVGLGDGSRVGDGSGFGAGLGDGAGVDRVVGRGVGVAVRRGVGVGVAAARTTIVPAIPLSMWTRQMYRYVPGSLKVTSKRPPGSTSPELKAAPRLGSVGPLPLVTVWGSPENVQTTVSPTAIVSVAGSKA